MVTQNEKASIARSYISTFYMDVVELTSIYGNYKSLMFELDTQSEKESIDPNLRNILLDNVNVIRQIVEKTYIYYITIVQNSKQFETSEEVKKMYNEISKKNIIELKHLYGYIIELNKFIANDVIENVLQQAVSIDNMSNLQS